jgi:GNAT superfamily N-acetyltransferase
MLSDSSCWCALAVVDGEARAVITVSTVLYVEWGRLGEIGDLYVLPEYRRRGLAQRLVAAAKDWCRAKGCSAVSDHHCAHGRTARPAQPILRPARLQRDRSHIGGGDAQSLTLAAGSRVGRGLRLRRERGPG